MIGYWIGVQKPTNAPKLPNPIERYKNQFSDKCLRLSNWIGVRNPSNSLDPSNYPNAP